MSATQTDLEQPLSVTYAKERCAINEAVAITTGLLAFIILSAFGLMALSGVPVEGRLTFLVGSLTGLAVMSPVIIIIGRLINR